jgi:hypothetical protein
MQKLAKEDALKVSGAGCRPSGQTYPAVICDGISAKGGNELEIFQKILSEIQQTEFTPEQINCVNNALGGAVLGASGALAGGPIAIGTAALGGGLMGSLMGGCFLPSEKKK